MPLSDKVSNIIGVPLPGVIKEQLEMRSRMNSLTTRDMSNIQYLENKTAWVRLISSVNLQDPVDIQHFKDMGLGLRLEDPSSLAKEFVLFGGTSAYRKNETGYSYNLRAGILGGEGFSRAYSPVGTKEIREYGYRPMPGITDVNIDTQGRMGSVRQAKVNFKCWDKYQLDIMDTLYFRLGFMMFLEWGNTYFYKKNDSGQPVLESTETYSAKLDPFETGLYKEEIISRISKLNRETEGNYDAMLGMVSNFNFSMNQEGGYDCTLTMISLGILAETIKINTFSAGNNVLNIALNTYNKNFDEAAAKKGIETVKAGNTDIEFFEPEQLVKAATDPTLKVPHEFVYPSNAASGSNDTADLLFNFPQGQKQNSAKNNGALIRRFGWVSRTNEKTKFKLDAGRFRDILNRSTYQLGAQTTSFTSLEKFFLDWYKANPSSPVYQLFYKGSDGKINYRIKFEFVNNKDSTSLFPAVFAYKDETGEGDALINDPKNIEHIREAAGSKLLTSITSTDQILRIKTYDTFYDTISLVTSGLDATDTQEKRTALLNLRAQDIVNALASNSYEWTATLNSSKATVRYPISYSTIVEAKFYLPIPNVDVLFKKETNQEAINATIKLPYKIRMRIEISDTYLIQDGTFERPPAPQPTGAREKANQTTATTGSAQTPPGSPGEEQTVSAEATQEPFSANSTLEASLFAIKVHALDKTRETNFKEGVARVQKVPLVEDGNNNSFHYSLFANGIFSSFIDPLVNDQIDDTNFDNRGLKKNDKLRIAAKYGFATNLMTGFTRLRAGNGTKNFHKVDYKDMLNAYVFAYEFNASGLNLGTGQTEKPVYITFGTLLMLLNSNCIIYDTTDKDTQTPLIYIDFNPYHNVCLSCPQHLSIDPWTGMIAFSGGDIGYASIFPPEILTPDGTKIRAAAEDEQEIFLFAPSKTNVDSNGDRVSGYLPSFHIPGPFSDGESLKESPTISSYQGYIMNILLNTDYLAKIVREESSKNDENKVFLKSFIEQVLVDLNRCLGNFNTFRMSYNDASNSIQIIDDQLIPTGAQATLSKKTEWDLPLFGKDSIAKSLEMKTEISTRLSNMIAISANSGVKAANGNDASSLGNGNRKLRDRYVADKSDIKPTNVSEDTDTENLQQQSQVMIQAAVQFNSTIKSIYGPAAAPSKDSVSSATNYYAEQLSYFKGTNETLQAAARIPISINFSTDGISGIAMGHSFTVSENVLPYTYSKRRSQEGEIRKVGFVIKGLTNSIRSNTWTTSISTDMIWLKDSNAIPPVQLQVPERVVSAGVTTDVSKDRNEKGEYALWRKGENGDPELIGYAEVEIINEGGLGEQKIVKKYVPFFRELQRAAKAAGHSLFLSSGFRTFSKQLELRQKHAVYPYKDGENPVPLPRRNDMQFLLNGGPKEFYPETARPGCSNHQNGTAYDLNTKSSVKMFEWLEENAAKYGFIRTVPDERWHWEYKPGQDRYSVVPKNHPSWSDPNYKPARARKKKS